jgi:hypothetical protein
LRCEHHPERGQHDVEAGVGEWEVFGVGGAQLDGDALGGGAGGGAVEELFDVVGAGDDATATGGGQGGVAVAGGDVDDELTGGDVDGFAQQLTAELQGGADRRVVT